MEQVLRSFNAKVDDVDTSKRTITAKINSAALDYYRSVIDPRGADLRNYNESFNESIEGRPNKPVLWEHGQDPAYGRRTIGRNLWIKADRSPSNGKIIACTQFKATDFAMELFDDYRNGFLSAWSVSVLPTDFGPPSKEEVRSRPELKDCEVVYRKWTLLEYSAVACPGNRECLSLSDDTVRSLNRIVMRGFWTPPEEIKPLLERTAPDPDDDGTEDPAPEPAAETAATESDPVDRRSPMQEPCDPAEEDCEEDEDGEEAPPPKKKKAKKKPVAKSEDDAETVEEGVMAAKDECRAEPETVTREVPVVEPASNPVTETELEVPAPVIELPALTGRTFEEIVASHILEERHHRFEMLRKLQEREEWLQGKA